MSTPFWVAGARRAGSGAFTVTDPCTGESVAEVGKPSDADIQDAVAAAAAAFPESRNLPVHVRAEALLHISARLAETVDANAETIAREGGKPLKWARIEAQRAVSTFRIAAEECRRFDGEFYRFDTE